MKTSIYITEQLSSNSDLNLSIDQRMPRIMFKMKKYYTIYMWNERSMDFDMPETAAKNTLVYRKFNKESQD